MFKQCFEDMLEQYLTCLFHVAMTSCACPKHECPLALLVARQEWLSPSMLSLYSDEDGDRNEEARLCWPGNPSRRMKS